MNQRCNNFDDLPKGTPAALLQTDLHSTSKAPDTSSATRLSRQSAWLFPLVTAQVAWAQGGYGPTGEAGLFGGVFILFIGLIVLSIAVVVWVAKDAQKRGMNAAVWVLIVLFFNFFGLLVYLFARPKGKLSNA